MRDAVVFERYIGGRYLCLGIAGVGVHLSNDPRLGSSHTVWRTNLGTNQVLVHAPAQHLPMEPDLNLMPQSGH